MAGHKDNYRLFSVRETLLGRGDAGERIYQTLLKAKRFINDTLAKDILSLLFEQEENSRLVLESVFERLHVGFIIPPEEFTISDMSKASLEAGFCLDYPVFDSAAFARELGELTGRPEVPTTIFMASLKRADECSGYMEAFIPSEEKGLVKSWIENEVGTHVGFTLTDPSALTNVQEAFYAEGFQVPAFMHGKPITNHENRASVLFFEKIYEREKIRIEILSPMNGARR